MSDFFELNTGAAVIDVYDNVLEDHLAEYVQSMMMGLSWKYEYFSTFVCKFQDYSPLLVKCNSNF